MPNFAYRARRANGTRIAGHVEAPDQGAALVLLQQRGLLTTELRSEATPAAGRQRSLRGRGAEAMAQSIAERLAMLLGAGIRLDRALQLMTEVGQGAALPFLRGILLEVRRGRPLSAALATRPDIFSPEFASMVAAGESSGTLPQSLRRLTDLLQTRRQDAARLRSALAYPMFLIGMAGVVLYILSSVVLPRFRPFFEGTRREKPPEMVVIFAISDAVQAAVVPILLLGALALLGVLVAMRRPALRARLDAWTLGLPVIGPFILQYQTARFAATLAAQVQHGVHIGSALGIAGLVVGNAAYRAAVDRLARAVVGGVGLSAAFEAERIFPPLLVQLVRLGEETNQLAEMLQQNARVAEQEARASVRRLETILAPALTLMIGAVVGAVILVVFYAVQSLYTLI